MRRNFKQLEQLARELGYSINRDKREIRWSCNQTPQRNGISFSIQDAVVEIKMDHQYRLEVCFGR